MTEWFVSLLHFCFIVHSTQVVGLQASTNNRATTVLELFLKAVQQYGAPSRCRADRGGENIEVSVWMIKYRGPNRGSFLWGTCVFFTVFYTYTHRFSQVPHAIPELNVCGLRLGRNLQDRGGVSFCVWEDCINLTPTIHTIYGCYTTCFWMK